MGWGRIHQGQRLGLSHLHIPNTQHQVPREHQTAILKYHLLKGASLDHPLLLPSSTNTSPHYVSSVSIRTQHLKLACLLHLPLHNLWQEQYLLCNRYSASYLLNLFSARWGGSGGVGVGRTVHHSINTGRVLFAQEENEAQSADINCPWRKQPGSPPAGGQ